jgi:predicted LPLAT superfamily acyltransferase
MTIDGSRGDPETSRPRDRATPPWWRRFLVRGVFWRQFLHWAAHNVPPWIEPAVISFWSLFFLLWGPGRRGVMRNLTAIKPGSTAIANFFRCYRVFWNYAWSIGDTVHFKDEGTVPDWEFAGWSHFEAMQARGGAILLTAHMGSYDLGAQIFSQTTQQRIVMVRAPEVDPQTRAFEDEHKPSALHIEFSAQSSELALDLLHAVTSGAIVAIQGDRVTPGITGLPATLFGKSTQVPAGPFALALAARAPIYPVFVVRRGRRRYRLVTFEPIEVVRGADRDAAFAAAVAKWTATIESLIGETWYQWFAFEPFSPELAQ